MRPVCALPSCGLATPSVGRLRVSSADRVPGLSQAARPSAHLAGPENQAAHEVSRDCARLYPGCRSRPAGLGPAAALQAATTTAYRFLGEPSGQAGKSATLVTYLADPRDDLAILSSPAAIVIDGIRVR
jgi:hypothetical protein